MTKSCQIIALFIMFLIVTIKNTDAIELRFPVACKVGTTCWITNHVDLDNTVGKVSDYRCGKIATDNNKSTHISLQSPLSANKNVPVIASQAGKIEIAGNMGGFCGTRVLITHDKGWQSNYCHLNPETLQVHKDQEVKIGQIIGTIGNSGQTNWPHLSFAIMRNDLIFDPFSGRTQLEGCRKNTISPLWAGGQTPQYHHAIIPSIGFTTGFPNTNAIIDGKIKNLKTLSKETLSLTLWANIATLRQGDQVTISLKSPVGKIMNHDSFTIKKDHTFYPITLPTLREKTMWDNGKYTGAIKIIRNINKKDHVIEKNTKIELY